MSYSVKEIFYTLQGEGAHAGRPAVFCRFAGCNLWSGREDDRTDAICSFCDTDFIGTDGEGGGKFSSADDLADAIKKFWPAENFKQRYVVCTGGEPLLQLDEAVIAALHKRGFKVAIETNGTLMPPHGIDWICVSPKADADFVLKQGDELKLVMPQKGMNPKDFENLKFERFSIQPMDGPNIEENTKAALAFCLENPQWQLSLQTHKMLGIR